MTGPSPRFQVLVVEDEYMIATELAEALAAAQMDVVGPVAGVGDALALLAGGRAIDAALLDVNVGHAPIWPVADALRARGVPIVLATGYDAGAIPPAYAQLPRCEKPAPAREIMDALAAALKGARTA